MSSEDTEMITLTVAEERTGVPVRTLRWALKVGKMWGEKRETPRGPVWYTTAAEAERYRRLYTPHVKKV